MTAAAVLLCPSARVRGLQENTRLGHWARPGSGLPAGELQGAQEGGEQVGPEDKELGPSTHETAYIV